MIIALTFFMSVGYSKTNEEPFRTEDKQKILEDQTLKGNLIRTYVRIFTSRLCKMDHQSPCACEEDKLNSWINYIKNNVRQDSITTEPSSVIVLNRDEIKCLELAIAKP